ncbi:MAG: hypothetical protein WCG06_06500, partial [Candidatus Omnitrophota bacterium]
MITRQINDALNHRDPDTGRAISQLIINHMSARDEVHIDSFSTTRGVAFSCVYYDAVRNGYRIVRLMPQGTSIHHRFEEIYRSPDNFLQPDDDVRMVIGANAEDPMVLLVRKASTLLIHDAKTGALVKKGTFRSGVGLDQFVFITGERDGVLYLRAKRSENPRFADWALWNPDGSPVVSENRRPQAARLAASALPVGTIESVRKLHAEVQGKIKKVRIALDGERAWWGFRSAPRYSDIDGLVRTQLEELEARLGRAVVGLKTRGLNDTETAEREMRSISGRLDELLRQTSTSGARLAASAAEASQIARFLTVDDTQPIDPTQRYQLMWDVGGSVVIALIVGPPLLAAAFVISLIDLARSSAPQSRGARLASDAAGENQLELVEVFINDKDKDGFDGLLTGDQLRLVEGSYQGLRCEVVGILPTEGLLSIRWIGQLPPEPVSYLHAGDVRNAEITRKPAVAAEPGLAQPEQATAVTAAAAPLSPAAFIYDKDDLSGLQAGDTLELRSGDHK